MNCKCAGAEYDGECECELPEEVAALRRILSEYESNARNKLHALRRSAILGMVTTPNEASEEKTVRRFHVV